MNQAFIFLGTNIEREKNYLEALRRLGGLGQLRRVSSVYETAPIGSGCENFYNGAILLETALDAPELKRALREIEAQMGRVRTADRYAPRTIDLDLVLYNQDSRDEEGLRLPDPLILRRPFLAQALAEVDPDYVHPVDGRTLAQIAGSFGGLARPGFTTATGSTSPGRTPCGETAGPAMQLQAEMTARVKNLLDEISTGEIYARRNEIDSSGSANGSDSR